MTTLEDVCEAVRLYVESLPTEGGRDHRDSWRDQIDNTLTDIRVALSSIKDADIALRQQEGRT